MDRGIFYVFFSKFYFEILFFRHLAKKWEAKWYPSTSGSNFELSREIDRIVSFFFHFILLSSFQDVLMLLDLLGEANPTISNTAGLGANRLFTRLAELGKFHFVNLILIFSEQKLRGLGCTRTPYNIFNSRISYNAVEDDHIPFMKRGEIFKNPYMWNPKFERKHF